MAPKSKTPHNVFHDVGFEAEEAGNLKVRAMTFSPD